MSNTKKCPFCGETILKEAKKCKHCGEWLNKIEPVNESSATGNDDDLNKDKLLADKAINASEKSTDKGKSPKSKLKFFIGVIVGVASLIIVGVSFFSMKQDSVHDIVVRAFKEGKTLKYLLEIESIKDSIYSRYDTIAYKKLVEYSKAFCDPIRMRDDSVFFAIGYKNDKVGSDGNKCVLYISKKSHNELQIVPGYFIDNCMVNGHGEFLSSGDWERKYSKDKSGNDDFNSPYLYQEVYERDGVGKLSIYISSGAVQFQYNIGSKPIEIISMCVFSKRLPKPYIPMIEKGHSNTVHWIYREDVDYLFRLFNEGLTVISVIVPTEEGSEDILSFIIPYDRCQLAGSWNRYILNDNAFNKE